MCLSPDCTTIVNMWEDEDLVECYGGIIEKKGLHVPKAGNQHTHGLMDFVNMLVPWQVLVYNYI